MRFEDRRQPFRLIDDIQARLARIAELPGFPVQEPHEIDLSDPWDKLHFDVWGSQCDIDTVRVPFIRAAVRAGINYDTPDDNCVQAIAWLDRVSKFLGNSLLTKSESMNVVDSMASELAEEAEPIRLRLWEIARIAEDILFPTGEGEQVSAVGNSPQDEEGSTNGHAVGVASQLWPRDRLQPDDITIWFHGERQYSRDGVRPIQVSEESDNILQAFLLRPSMSIAGRKLEALSGVSNASRALRNLREGYGGVFKDAIRCPGERKGGGYFVLVRLLRRP